MKKNRFFATLRMTILVLAGTLAWTGCMKEESIQETPEEQPTEEPAAEAADSVWTVTIQAVKEIPGQAGNDVQTKGLEIEGDEETTTVIKSIWKDNEPVKVYRGTECIGTLTATPDGEDPHKATLSGNVITSDLEANVTTLTLLTPRADWDYTGQAGILLEEGNSIEKMYHYTAAVGILVTSVDEMQGTFTTETATFNNQQSIYRMNFRYLNPGSTKLPITTKTVTITSAGGHLVQSQAVDGTSLVEGAISVTLGTASANPFFVALRNGDVTDAEDLTFTVIDADGVTYRGTKTIPAEYKPNGTFVSIKKATLNDRLGVSLSATEVATVW